MKKKQLISQLVLVPMLVILLSIFATPCFAESNQGGEYYDTKSFDVNITIDEQNRYHVTERILVDFNQPRHGIFRYIPYKTPIVRAENGQATWYPHRANVKIDEVMGDDFEVSNEEGNVMVKIGNADRTIHGEKEYEISYTYRPHDDRSSEFDEVYYNVLPVQWPTSIENATITIQMPKAFDASKVAFYAGEYGNQDKSYIDWKVTGNTISGKLVKPMPAYNAATIKIDLPDGYFTSQKTDAGMIALMWIAIIGCPLLILLLWLLLGRDPKLIKPIAVKAPDWMRPSEAGYIVDGVVETRDMISLLFYWAEKGYIHIIENETGSIELTKRCPLPDDSRTYEHTIFDKIFRLGDVVETSSLEGNFYQTLALAKSQVQMQFNAKDSTRLYTKSSIFAKGLSVLLAVVPFLASLLISHYINIAPISATILSVVSAVILFLCFATIVGVVSTWNGKEKGKREVALVAPIVISFIVVAVNLGYLYMEKAEQLFNARNYASLYINPTIPILCGAIASFLCVAFASIMRKRTDNMNTWYGEVLGLKEFIEVAEKDRLEMIVQESPNYFYDILPYAYVLGVSEKWAAKFENIAMPEPEWYSGTTFNNHTFNTMLFISAMNRNMDTISHNISIPPPPSSSGGGGFSGGGFSGGGFSGGGGGGGGGGSW